VQTFLPMIAGFGGNQGFPGCAHVLDNKRLGKQRVECLQILNALAGKSKGWRNHPAVLMWHGHEECLKVYMDCMVQEWERRGFKNTIPKWGLTSHANSVIGRKLDEGTYFPDWFKDDALLAKVAASHRSNLLRKDSAWYGQYGWQEPNDLPYVWPVTKADIQLKRVMEFCA
jgi:hypothetical protein